MTDTPAKNMQDIKIEKIWIKASSSRVGGSDCDNALRVHSLEKQMPVSLMREPSYCGEIHDFTVISVLLIGWPLREAFDFWVQLELPCGKPEFQLHRYFRVLLAPCTAQWFSSFRCDSFMRFLTVWIHSNSWSHSSEPERVDRKVEGSEICANMGYTIPTTSTTLRILQLSQLEQTRMFHGALREFWPTATQNGVDSGSSALRLTSWMATTDGFPDKRKRSVKTGLFLNEDKYVIEPVDWSFVHFVSVMAGRAEFKNWDSYWVILLENKTPLELKKSIIKLAPWKTYSRTGRNFDKHQGKSHIFRVAWKHSLTLAFFSIWKSNWTTEQRGKSWNTRIWPTK